MVPLPLLAGLPATTHTQTQAAKHSAHSSGGTIASLWAETSSFCGSCWHRVFPFWCHNLFLSQSGMMSSFWCVGSSTSQFYTPDLRFAVGVLDKVLIHVAWRPGRLAWEDCPTFRLVLERGWLRLLNLHGSDGGSTGSLWTSGVTPSVPGSWYIPMETGRSFLDWKENQKTDSFTRNNGWKKAWETGWMCKAVLYNLKTRQKLSCSPLCENKGKIKSCKKT